MARTIDYKLATPEQVVAALGERLARVRLSRNISQNDLAGRAGISERTLKRFEAGENVSLDTLIRLMQALGLESHLENLLPEPGIQPMERIEMQGRERQRARRTTRKPSAGAWRWGDEESS